MSNHCLVPGRVRSGRRLGRVVAVVVVLALVVSGVSVAAVVGGDRPERPLALVPAGVEACLAGSGAKSAAAVGALDYEQLVRPGEKRVVAFDGAQVAVPADAVTSPVTIGITGLSSAEVPRLDAGMSNVTGAGAKSGFRFTPHPYEFAAPVEVTLPYDPAQLPSGVTAQEIFTYFFNEAGGCWQVLERVSVDEQARTVTSRTDHFTDMINATATVPEHPENMSFNPNQLKEIQAASPAAGVNLIAPPGANNHGDNNLSYPFEVPAGRGGVQPSLGVGYSSAGGNGWLGVGWDVATPAVMVDTRWGVPRYDVAKETESYLLGGAQLTPVAHRGPLVARSTGDKTFHARVEGGFAKIVRKGTDPKSYTWEVIDKAGTRSVYGGAGATLADDAGNVFMWGLREVRDLHDNFMRFHYVLVEDTGLDSGTKLGRNLYPQKITWTGRGATEGRYSVTFIRDREMSGEALRVDKLIDARGGFKRVTADRLRRVEVKLDSTLIRRYELSYTTGAFGKTLLKSLAQHDSNGVLFNKHDFSYFDDIRDGDGKYQAFQSAAWTVPGDDLGNGLLNLAPAQPGDASALGANSSKDSGHHLYVGLGPKPTKSNSVGVKIGGSDSASDGVLALVDVDGDNLPDKVFRSGGKVKYRKNLSTPGGQLAFDDQVRELAGLPGIGRERSQSSNRGMEAYPGPAAAQLNRVNVTSTTDRYFTDVNGDGIADLVIGTSVFFGRIGSGGTPVYGLNDSSGTPAPVQSGTLDTSTLFPDFAAERERLIDSFPLLDTVRRWVAPFDGKVRIEGAVRLAPETEQLRAESEVADGVKVAIQHENTQLWSDVIKATDNTEHKPANVDQITVSRGQRIYFRVQSRFDGTLDTVDWNPKVSYLHVPAGAADVNNLPVFVYEASRDFTMGGRAAQIKAPLTGTLHLSGNLVKSAPTSDDVTVLVTRDGTPVLQHTLVSGAAGSIPVNLDIPVQKDQVLTWRVKIDSPIDLGTIKWAPRAHYTAAEGVERVFGTDGQPLIVVQPPFEMDMYPAGDELAGPQPFWTSPWTTALPVKVIPQLDFAFGQEKPSGRVTFTVKRKGAPHGVLLGKAHYQITNGVVTGVAPIPMTISPSDQLVFDFSTLNPELAEFVTSRNVRIEPETLPAEDVAGVVHSAAAEGAFPQPYRGWASIGYNGNRDRADQPIVQGDLVVDQHYGADLPDSVDPPAQEGPFSQDPTVTPPKSVPFFPLASQDASHLSGGAMWGAGEYSWLTGTRASSSRLGAPSIGLPSEDGFAGARALPRIARSEQTSLTGSVGNDVASLGGSKSKGASQGLVDFLDMNGDGFPDAVGTNGIQYTDPTGGFGPTVGATPDGAVRSSYNRAGNASAGASARTVVTGRSDASPSGQRSAKTAEAGNDMPPFGVGVDVGGNIGGSDSDAVFDLIDINGDNLPDRVYDNGRVALNLGYRFAEAELWRGPDRLNDGSGTNFGINIGFNVGNNYSFAGGASFSQASTKTAAMLADMNGDGLPDRVFDGVNGGPIRVGFNTGNGFETPVDFHGSLAGIAKDSNASLGAGAYFTFPVCYVVACAIFNPGAHTSIGASRTEQALRDLNGDGYADHLASTKDNQLVVAHNRTGRTNLLRSVKRPLGALMEFDYTRDGNTYDLPQSRFVLSQVKVHDGHAGDGQDTQLSTFEYAGGIYDRLEREFRGYATVTTRARDIAAPAGQVAYRSTTSQFRTDSYYTKGLLTRTVVTDAAGKKFTETENSYAVRDVANPSGTPDLASTSARLFPHLTRTDQRFFEGQTNPGKTTYTSMFYDAVGNVERTVDGGDAGTADDVETVIGYANCPTQHVLATPNSIEVRTSGGVVRRKRTSTIDCPTGEVRQVRAVLAAGQEAVTDLTYAANGNLTRVVGPTNKHGDRFQLDYGYDTTVGSYVESVTDKFGLVSSSTHDYKFGEVLTSTDTNGKTITNTYDSVGRLDTVTGPYEAGSGVVTIDFEYHHNATVPYAITRHVDRKADNTVKTDTIDTITFVDGLGRAIQTKADAAVFTSETTPAADVMIISGHVVYDFLGRAIRTHFPKTEPKGAANTTFHTGPPDSVQPTVTSFDVLDRVTKTVLPDNTESTVSYGFGPDRAGATQFETISTDANNKSARAYTDVKGQTTAVKQFNPAGGASQAVIWTSFGYNPLDEKISITDNANNVTSMEYDNFGRNTAVISPDSGRTDTVYDLAGNVSRKITAKLAAQQKAIEYDYDFTRLKKIRYPLFTGNDVTYTYGAPGAPNNAAGRVTTIEYGATNTLDGVGREAYEYGPLGETTKQTRTVPGQGSHIYTFVTQYRYDTWNRLLSMTYPDGETLSYRYNSGGDVDGATGTKTTNTYPYLNRLDYDKFGQRVLVEAGNGTRTRYTYNSITQRLDNLKARLGQGYEFQNLNYTYDKVGNILTLANNTTAPSSPAVGAKVGGPGSETYTYDDLYRLTHAQGTYQPSGPKTYQYTLDTTYDSISNITTKNQRATITSGGNTQTDNSLTYNYGYGYTGRPHAATIGIFTFQYDANGNQTSRNQAAGGPRRQLIWDEENRLACTHENVQNTTFPQDPTACDNAGGTTNSKYLYDHTGQRIVKNESHFHVYPNPNYSTRSNKEFKHVYIGPTKLLTKTVEQPQQVEDQQFYAHGDHLGSTGFTTDRDGKLAEHLKYIPGGETWTHEHPAQPVPHQYTGKEYDPQTGFYYHGARYYDPRTSNWQGTDPALPARGTNTQTLSTYLYTNANPLRYTDPDGREPRDPVIEAAIETFNEEARKARPNTPTGHPNSHASSPAREPTAPGGWIPPDAKAKPGLLTRMDKLWRGNVASQLFRAWLETGDGAGMNTTYDRNGKMQRVMAKEAVQTAVQGGDEVPDKTGGRATRHDRARCAVGTCFDPSSGTVNRTNGLARGASKVLFWGSLYHSLKGDYSNIKESAERGISRDELYDEQARKRGGVVRPAFLPGLTIDRCKYSPSACPTDIN